MTKTERNILRDCSESTLLLAPLADKFVQKMAEKKLITFRKKPDGWFAVKATKVGRFLCTRP